MAALNEALFACPECDLLQRVPELPPGGKARCPRCGGVVAVHKTDSLDRTLALTVAAAISYVVANAMPLMRLSAAGRTASTTTIGGAYQMWALGQKLTAVLVWSCAVVAPALLIAFTLTLLLGARRSPAPVWVGTMLRWTESDQPWAMVEVMTLGLLVAVVKIAQLAEVVPGVGMFATGALIFLLAAMKANFDPEEVWKRVRWASGQGAEAPGIPEGAVAGGSDWTAARRGLVSCEACGLLSRPPGGGGHCPRCGEEVAFRFHNSVQRAWALVVAAAICYVPANILPIMTSNALGKAEEDTIISGVVLLYTTGSWPLALIVLIASVMIPLAKLGALAYLLVTVQRGSTRANRERTRLYRLVELVGRWSMLDVFVVTVTVALIQLQPLMSVAPGTGVLFFGAVVVLTMLAAEAFDPRLIWDSSQGRLDRDE